MRPHAGVDGDTRGGSGCMQITAATVAAGMATVAAAAVAVTLTGACGWYCW